ncbi:SMC-Scp complex subunit ScpB [Candidatus Uhrbacteria bacterium]|nr:SMC-Scp complex subunit ScpB [Candidatus Uhrbacteria bacterium]
MSQPQELQAALEAILFVSIKPLSMSTIAQLLHCDSSQAQEAVEALDQWYRGQNRGLQVLRQGNTIQLMSHPRFGALVSALYREETTGELTRPALETLTIIAYRGPIRKSELDQIRGVNCALILRNLMLRGLILEEEIAKERMYCLTMECIRSLGISRVEELPEYALLHSNEKINAVAGDV